MLEQRYEYANILRAFNMLASDKLHSHIWIEKLTGISIWHTKQIENKILYSNLHLHYPEKAEKIAKNIWPREGKRLAKLKQQYGSSNDEDKVKQRRKQQSLYNSDPNNKF